MRQLSLGPNIVDEFPSGGVTPDRGAAQPDNDRDRGLALFQARDFEVAEAHFRRYLATHPKDLIALNNAALVAKALGRPEVALMRLGKAVRYHPQSAQSQFNLGNTLQEVGRLDEAIQAYRRAIDLRPDYVKAHLNLGNALDSLHRFAEAASCYHRALALGGDHAETHSNLGNCYKTQNKFREALTHFICAATLEPHRPEFHCDVGIMRFAILDYPEAIESFNRVLEVERDHSGVMSLLWYIQQSVCDWTETGRLGPLVRAATDEAWAVGARSTEGPLESVSRDADPARNFRVATDFAAQFAAPPRPTTPPRRGSASKSRKLRVGYLSVDFREHAVAHVMAGVIDRHDRERFEIFAYSYGADDGSPWRARIEGGSDHFVDLTALDDHHASMRIREDRIDILVDLTLWTRGSRPRICAPRPATVQVQYLGFPGTSGAPFFDYAIVDQTVVPPEHRQFWSETLVFMPHCYFMPDNSQTIAKTGMQRRHWDLPDQSIVFCSFNQSYKIEPTVFSAWMQILTQVPDSVLWLSTGSPATQENLAREALRQNVDPRRLVFAGRVDDKSEHLERLGLADVALDTLTYNGHTTTADALWAGTPVISMLGGHFASRVSGSMLRAAGLPELIASDIDGYIRLAVELAASPRQRSDIRTRLLESRTSQPLFDTDRAVKKLETAYEQIFANHLRGTPPEDLFMTANNSD